MRFPSWAPLVLLGLAACNTAPSTPPEQALPAMPMEVMKEATRILSSDEFEGRAPGTAGETKTLDYLVAQFQKAGLQPGNPNGPDGRASWFQDVPLVAITAKNVSPLAFTGGAQPISLNYGSQMVVGSYRVTPRVAVKDSPVVFVGYGINAPERGWNDYAGVDVKGKTVVILINDPDWETPGLDGVFGGRAMTYYGRWTYKFEEAARQGAAAALIVHQTEPAAYGWSVVESSWTGEQQVADAPNGHMDQTAANGWIQLNRAKALFASGGQDFDTLATAAKTKGFKAVPIGEVKASVSFDNVIRKHASKNVIGILPGTKRPDEVVLYTAHWDHLGRCQPAPDGDDICNGAIDNATGTAALIAVAQANKAAGAPERSLVFLAVTAEESGLLGSAYYGANPIYPLAKTVGGVNMDALNITPPARNVVVVGKGKSQLDVFLERALAAQGRTATAELTPEKGFYYRSDHFSLAKYGVPMLYFEAGGDLIEGGAEAGKAAAMDYEKNRYHGPKDEYNPAWNWAGVEKDLQIYYGVGRALAMTSEWPNWVEGDEFRAIRDKSRAGATQTR